jgi:hypothetical protein
MSSSATKMRSSRWRLRSGLFISKGEDAAQRFQRFVHGEIPFEATFHRRFALLALNVHELRRRSKAMSVFSRLVKDICDCR